MSAPAAVSVQNIAFRKTLQHNEPSLFTSNAFQLQPTGNGFSLPTPKSRAPPAVISTATNRVERWIDLPGEGYGSAVTPDGAMLTIAIPSK